MSASSPKHPADPTDPAGPTDPAAPGDVAGAASPAGSGGPGSPPGRARVRLVGKPGCHLCDEARQVVASECERAGVSWVEVSILDDPELHARYWDLIPVVEVDGRRHDVLRVDARRLRDRLARSPGRWRPRW